MFTITKKDIKDSTVYVSENWVSNGQWAVKRNLIKNIEKFKSEDTIREYVDINVFREMEDTSIERTAPSEKTLSVEYSGIVENNRSLDRNCDKAVYLCTKDSETRVLFDRRFIEMLQLADETLYGKDSKSAFANTAGNIILMPKQ